jgi:hypothetical protein
VDSKVLVGAVTSKRHEEYLEKWVDMVNSFTYPHDLFIIDSTIGLDYYDRIKEMGVDVVHYEWDTDNKNAYEMLSDTRNLLRDRFLEGDYTHFLNLDTDEFVPKDTIDRLLSHNKDVVGFPSPIWHKVPGVFKEGGYVQTGQGFKLATFTWDELFERVYKEKTQLLEVNSVSIGCCLFSKKVFEKIYWRVPKIPPIAEDTMFFSELTKKGFKSYVDMGVIPLHLSVGWRDVPNARELFSDGRLNIAYGFVTDDDTRTVDYYGPKKPGNGDEKDLSEQRADN